MKRVKNFFVAFAAALLSSHMAAAQISVGDGASALPLTPNLALTPDSRPVPTAAEYIAMVFYKLTLQEPAFDSWAQFTDAYKTAEEFQKSRVQESESARLRSTFSLTTLTDGLVLSLPVHLSDYSFRNKGFTITGIDEKTYFPFEYAGNFYAVVIPGISDYQWVPLDGLSAMTLDEAAVKSGRAFTAQFMAEPTFADKTAPLTLNGKPYWLISARLTHVSLYAGDAVQPAWEQDITPPSEKPSQELLDLRK